MESGLDEGLKPSSVGAERLFPETAEPRDHAGWLELAASRRAQSDGPGERRALERAAELAFRPQTFDRRTILLCARRLTHLRASESAAAAWRMLLSVDRHHVESKNHLAELELYGPPSEGRQGRLRLGILGNCQAYSLADLLRRLYPDLEIRAMGVGELDGPEEATATAELYSGFDAVVSQPLGRRRGPLSTAAMAASARRYIRFPSVLFNGFHPDMIYAGAYPRGLHSRLVLAGFAMGLPQERVAGLFNAYVYGLLGYFDACAKAERYLVEAGRPYGFELETLVQDWRVDGPFMHTPTHPGIRVFSSIAEKVAGDLDLGPPQAGIEAPDMLEPLGVWPVYPEIARRLGMAGELTFRFQSTPPMGLEAMIAQAYAFNATLDLERVRESVGDVIELLRGEGV